MIDRGELPAYHLGRRVRVSRRDFDRFVEARYQCGVFQAGHQAASSVWDGELLAPETTHEVEPSDAVDDRR